MATIRVVCRLGPAGDTGIEAHLEAAEAQWERVRSTPGDPEAEAAAYAEVEHLAAELDALDDARHVEALLSDDHPASQPGLVLLIDGLPRPSPSLPPGSEVFIEPHGGLRRWEGDLAQPASVQELQHAQAIAVEAGAAAYGSIDVHSG